MNRIIRFALLNSLLMILIVSAAAQAKTSILNKYILVIDMQEIGTLEKLEPLVAQQLIDNVNRVIERADPQKVIYVEAIMAKLNISLQGLQIEVLPGMFLDKRLKLVNDTRIVKTTADTFTAKQFKSFIDSTGANDFVIVGMMAEHCIKATALGGIENGFRMLAIPEAIAGESEIAKNEALSQLAQSGVEIIPLSEIK
ncbi:MAG: cysteine hydrolase family protein [Draconibacterium sp.]